MLNILASRILSVCTGSVATLLFLFRFLMLASWITPTAIQTGLKSWLSVKTEILLLYYHIKDSARFRNIYQTVLSTLLKTAIRVWWFFRAWICDGRMQESGEGLERLGSSVTVPSSSLARYIGRTILVKGNCCAVARVPRQWASPSSAWLLVDAADRLSCCHIYNYYNAIQRFCASSSPTHLLYIIYPYYISVNILSRAPVQ